MSVLMAQAKIKVESVSDVRAATKKMFAAINAAQPEGIRYASLLLSDGETFVAVVQLDDGLENPIPGFPEFRELQEIDDSNTRATQLEVGFLAVVLRASVGRRVPTLRSEMRGGARSRDDGPSLEGGW
jgi:hypothetical protein